MTSNQKMSGGGKSITITGISIVVPFYNEERAAEDVVSKLLGVFKASLRDFEIVCVQNGSQDGTSEILNFLAKANPELRIVDIPRNQGYGYGIIQGLLNASKEIVGYADGDGQISPEDIVKVLSGVTAKRAARGVRSVRQDGLTRKTISVLFNFIFRTMFGLRFADINGKPKFFRAEDVKKMALISRDWFIDSEIMLKSSAMNIEWSETPIAFGKRPAGSSNVKLSNIFQFLKNLLMWRFYKLSTWKKANLR